MRVLSWSWIVLSLGMLVGCFPKGDPSKPIPTTLIAASQKAQRVVIVLPGRGDDLGGLARSNFAEAVQSAWPDADVILTGLALGYYMQGQAERRLHDDVVAPARTRGYREIWMVGASMGGMGALMYDRAHPDAVDGIVLLAPYLGEKPLLQEIAAAGGIAEWNPRPAPAAVNADNFQYELWRHLRTWGRDPDKVKNVWLAYGDRDRLREAMPVLTPLLRPEQVLVRDGGHAWSVWSPATRDVLLRIDATRKSGR